MMKKPYCAALAALLTLAGCNDKVEVKRAGGDFMPATLKANEQFAKELKLDDQQDFEDAKRGLIARPRTNPRRRRQRPDRLRRLQVRGGPARRPSTRACGDMPAQRADRAVQGHRWHLPVAWLRHGQHDAYRRQDGWIVIDTLTAGDRRCSAGVCAQAPGRQACLRGGLLPQPHRPFRRRAGCDLAEGGGRAQGPGRGFRRIHGRGDQRERDGRHRHGPALELPVRQGPGAVTQGMVDTGLGKGVGYGTFGILPPTTWITQPTEEWSSTACASFFTTCPAPRRRPR